MAPLTFHVLLTCLLCLLQTGSGQDGPTTITVTPATLTLMPNVSDTTGGQVTISCRASSVGAGEIMTVINIQRVLHASPNASPVVVVAASLSATDAVLKLSSLQGSATVSGSLTDKTITLNLNRANCGDAGMYICEAFSVSSSEVKMYTSSRNLTIEVSPGSITMITEPSGVNNWRANDTLLMRCNGIVGTVQDDSQLEWVWQYQDANGFPGVDNWQPYGGIGDPDTEISTDPLMATTNPCYKRQISTLTRRLTGEDTGRQYRCYVNNRDVSSDSADLAQVYRVGIVTKSAVDLTSAATVPTSPTPKPTTQAAIRHDVVCGSTSMSFSIPMPANFKQTATLSDPRCQAQTLSNNSLYGSTNLNDCGTTLKVTNDSIVFSNNIILPFDGSSNSSVIRVIPIMCRYDRMTDLTVSAYMPVVRQVLFTETGVGQLSFRIRQYRDSSFTDYVSDSAYPLRLMPSEEVFVQLDLDGQQTPQGFGMDVVRCVASPSPSYMGVLGGLSKENLIDNNCPASTDVHLWNRTISASSKHSLFRFSFKAVTFPDPSDPQRSSTGLVYIHCRVRLCTPSECGSGGQCPSPSALSRNKREAEGVEGAAGHQLSTGPLLVEGHSGEPNAFSPLVVVMGAIAACATLVAMVAVVAWRRSRHRGHHQRLQEVTAGQQ